LPLSTFYNSYNTFFASYEDATLDQCVALSIATKSDVEKIATDTPKQLSKDAGKSAAQVFSIKLALMRYNYDITQGM
jgi:hypothetical protein